MDLVEITALANKALNRRGFLKGTGMAGLGIASTTLIGGRLSPLMAENRNGLNAARKSPTTIHDTPAAIFTAALVAEDLATLRRHRGSRKSFPTAKDCMMAARSGPMRNSMGTASAMGRPPSQSSPMHHEPSAVIDSGMEAGSRPRTSPISER